MGRCWFCGSQLYWGCDFNFEDYGLEGEGIVAEVTCGGCGATATFYQSLDDNENKAKDIVEEVVEYLNSKLGTKFKAKSERNKKGIKARAKEGYTLDDMKAVIDYKYNEWIGTEYQKHLNPQTLFRADNFTKYYNQRCIDGQNRKSDNKRCAGESKSADKSEKIRSYKGKNIIQV